MSKLSLIIPPELNKISAKNFILSLFFDTNKLTFAIFSSKTNKLLGTGIIKTDHSFNTALLGDMEMLFEKYNFLLFNYANVFINFFSNKFTIVPFKIFNKNIKKQLLQSVSDIDNDEIILHNTIHNKYVNIYTIPSLLYHFFKNQWNKLQFFHIASVVINDIINMFATYWNTEQSNYIIFVLKINKHSLITLFYNDSLLSSNLFFTPKAEDVFYYIIYSLKSNEKVNNVNIILSGDINYNSKEYELLNKSFFLEINKKVEIYNFKELKVAKPLKDLFYNDYYIVLNQVKCV